MRMTAWLMCWILAASATLFTGVAFSQDYGDDYDDNSTFTEEEDEGFDGYDWEYGSDNYNSYGYEDDYADDDYEYGDVYDDDYGLDDDYGYYDDAYDDDDWFYDYYDYDYPRDYWSLTDDDYYRYDDDYSTDVDSWERPRWTSWGYDDSDEEGLWDW